jgi:hypothetical protein
MEATRITDVLSVNDGLVSSAKLFKNVKMSTFGIHGLGWLMVMT